MYSTIFSFARDTRRWLVVRIKDAVNVAIIFARFGDVVLGERVVKAAQMYDSVENIMCAPTQGLG